MSPDPVDLFDPRALQGDEGMTEMVIFDNAGKVVMRFARPMLHVAFDPSNAVEIAKKMIDCAVQCGANVTIQVPRREISKEKRDALVVRAMLIMRSLESRPLKHRAIQLVDTILSAID